MRRIVAAATLMTLVSACSLFHSQAPFADSGSSHQTLPGQPCRGACGRSASGASSSCEEVSRTFRPTLSRWLPRGDWAGTLHPRSR